MMKFFGFTTKVSEFPKFLNFQQPGNNFETFPKSYLIGKPIVSGLKRVTAGSVSEKYQTRFCAQFSKKF